MQTSLFHNKTGLKGEDLKSKIETATTQQENVENIFRQYSDLSFTRDEICEKLPDCYPVSVGRCITNLKNEGVLEKTKVRRMGHLYGATQYAYKLK